MKIHPNQINRGPEIYQSGAAKPKRPDKGPGAVVGEAGTKLTVSDAARELRAARQKLAELPDVREERVAELQRQIAAGRYRVSGRQVAEKLVRQRIDFRA